MSINLEARKVAIAACNASRKRRFTTDPAKADFYAKFRQKRFTRRFGFTTGA